jgi:hypothetical protein
MYYEYMTTQYFVRLQTAIYDSKVKLFLKQGISHQLGRDAVVRFECENSAIDVIINFFMKNIPQAYRPSYLLPLRSKY